MPNELPRVPEVERFVVDDDGDARGLDDDKRGLVVQVDPTDGLLLSHAKAIVEFLKK